MSDTVTAFLSGNNSPYSITTFDWTTMGWNTRSVQFNGNRVTCSCGLIKTQNGELLVAAAGERTNLSQKNLEILSFVKEN
jgi:hypothetical protein